jgi:uncharacterized protein YdiU (UPF0061 family)
LDKLITAMEREPAILNYFGLSEQFVLNQQRFFEKYDKIKNFTSEDKKKTDAELWTKWLEKYLKRVYDFEAKSDERIHLINANNPRFILRNHLAQSAIESAENNEFNDAKMFLKVLENPFSNDSLTDLLSEFDKDGKY